MATVCEYCGHKTNEVKSGGGIEPKGKKIILQITDPSDLTRDILKVRIIPEFLTVNIFQHTVKISMSTK